MWAQLKNIVLLCVATVSFCASKSNLLDFYDFRCNAASIPSLNTGSYCDIISWTAARVYPVSLGVESGRFYDAGNPFGIAEQDNIARRYGAAIIPNVTTPECRNALKWLSCTTVFPRCLVIGAVSHLEPCQYQCKQVQDACTDLQIDCSSFSSTSCTFYVAEGFNTLPLHKGPFDLLPYIYASFVGLWGVLLLFWWALSMWFRDYSWPKFHFIIGCIIFVQLLSRVVCFSFWFAEVKYTYLYKQTASLSYMKQGLRFLEAGHFIYLMVLARGIFITQFSLSPMEFAFTVLVGQVLFFVSAFLPTVVDRPPTLGWIIFTGVVYSFIYGYLILLVATQVRHVRGVLRKLRPEMPLEVREAFTEKEIITKGLFFVILSLFGIEATAHTMFALSYISTQTLILTYEAGLFSCLIALAILYRPRYFSPFFFMGTLDEAFDFADAPQTDISRALPVVVLHRDGEDMGVTARQQQQQGSSDYVVELVPLLTPPNYDPEYDERLPVQPVSKMVVLEAGDGTLSLGVRENPSVVPPARPQWRVAANAPR